MNKKPLPSEGLRRAALMEAMEIVILHWQHLTKAQAKLLKEKAERVLGKKT